MFSAAASAEQLQGAGNLWAPWTMQDNAGNAIGISVDLFPDDYTAAYTFKTISKLAFRFHSSKKIVIPQFNEAIRTMQQEHKIQDIIAEYTQ